jgi:Selenocysteine lyase
MKVDESGELDLNRFEEMLDERVKIVSVAHISNVLGVVNPISDIVRIAHAHGIPVAVDGAQGIVHSKVDVKDQDCDFYIFSGHKIYAPTGTGVLYGKRELLEALPPYMGGGDMVGTVTFEKTTYAELPLKFEAGTPNYTAAACYAPALELAARLREDSEVQEDERRMKTRMLERLDTIEGLRIYGLPKNLEAKAPVFSMTVEGCHPSDIAQLLDKMGVAVRSGLMCAEPLIRRWSDKGMLRASLMPYNTLEEVDYFADSLIRAVRMLR